MSNSVEYILSGDIGATNARFALLSNGKLNAIKSFEVAKFGQFTDLLANFLQEHCRQKQIHQALLAIAGPVTGERVVLTNSSWVIDPRELQTGFGCRFEFSTTSKRSLFRYPILPRLIWRRWEAVGPKRADSASDPARRPKGDRS
jgi:Glucokinase